MNPLFDGLKDFRSVDAFKTGILRYWLDLIFRTPDIVSPGLLRFKIVDASWYH